MKKLIVISLLGSFIFSGISFNKSTVFGGLDDVVSVSNAMGVDFDMNDQMSIGYDTGIGMLVKASIPTGLTLRVGYNANNTSTIGVSYNWWTGGEVIKTSIGTVVDYSTAGTNTDDATVRVNLGWGF